MYRALTCLSLISLLFCIPVAEGRNYAVLISAGEATADDAEVNSSFWYNMYLQYTTLLEEGYDEDDVYVLYGWGADFNSSHACYQPPYPVTDFPVNRANIQSVFNTVAGVMTSSDFLYVWWMGHGAPDGTDLVMGIDTTGELVYDYEIAAWVGQITNYDVRTFSWMTCHSGGILDNFEGSRSIVMSSATFYESTYDQWLCDTFHAEFHYPERCAWAWETPCAICGPVDADSDDNGRVSFQEAFTYAEANTALSSPQISDLGGLAPDTFLGGCTSQGKLELDQAEYPCSGDAGIGVVDCDLNTDDGIVESTTVTIESTTEPGGETVLLTETDPASADFRGTIELSTSDAPGVLHITEGDVVTATYIDADDGQGGVNVVVIDTAVVDCTPPQISNVQTASVQPHSATVTFDTDEPTEGTVRYGSACGALGEQATEAGFETDHTVNLSGLDDSTTYFYAVDAEDKAGNAGSDDNGGACYTFTTPYTADHFTEEFTGDLDLENHTVTFTPVGSAEFYEACIEEATGFPTDPTGGTTLTLWDDDYAGVTLTGGATVALYGTSDDTFYAGSNGYVTFTSGDSEYWPMLDWHFDLPRISALFVDLDPSAGGTISWKQLADRAAVTWQNVPECCISNSNSFQIEMFFDGRIRITWLSMDAASGISGLSEGEGLPPDFLESDLSTYGSCVCDPPPVPANPDPADGAVDVPVDTQLTWESSTPSVCDLPNGGFEAGLFAPWAAITGPGGELTPWSVTIGGMGYFENGYPLEGDFFTQNGFDGDAGLFYDLYQEVLIPAGTATAVLNWSERIQWDMFGSLPRLYEVTVEPAGGGAPLATLYSTTIGPTDYGDTGYVPHSVDLLGVAPGIAGSTVRINFHEEIPENFTGPAQFDLDAIQLTCDGVMSTTRGEFAAEVSDTAQHGVVGTRDAALLQAKYSRVRERALRRDVTGRTGLAWSTAPVVGLPFGAARSDAERLRIAQVEASEPGQAQDGLPTVGRYPASAFESRARGTVEILAFNGYSDNSPGGEYENTLNAIAEHFVDFNVTATTTEDPGALALELVGKDVFLLPEQENWNPADMYTFGSSLAGTLASFVAGGGVVIVLDYIGICGECGGAFLNGTGLMSVGAPRWVDPDTARVNGSHPITDGVAATFVAMDGANAYDSISGATVPVVHDTTGDPMVAVSQTNGGPTLLIGFDYFTYNTDMARVVANAVQLGAPPCPTTYDVYLDAAGDCPPTTLVCADLDSPICDPGLLDAGTTYCWQVVACNPAGCTYGPVWTFTTTEINHDVAVTNVTPSETVVFQGEPVSIDVGVENQGDFSETFDVTAYYGTPTVPNGGFEKDPPGTEKDDITDWDHDLVDHVGNPPTGDDLQVVDDYHYSGGNSVYTYLQTTSVPPFPGDSRISQDLVAEEPLVTSADYITLWVSGDGYTTSSRYHWWIELRMSDGDDTYAKKLRCDCWGLNEGCTPNHFDYYDELKAGADGNTWKRYTTGIPGELDKSNLTVTIRHRQQSWDLTQASSWYRLDSIYFSDAGGNPYSQVPIDTKVVSDLSPGNQTNVVFIWDTSGAAPGEHVLSAYAHPVPDETDVSDNTYVDGTVFVEPSVGEALPAPYPHNRARNRYLSFDPNKAVNDGHNVGFKITLTSLSLGSCDDSGSLDVEGWPCRTDDDCRACSDSQEPCWTANLHCPGGESCDATGAVCRNDYTVDDDPEVGKRSVGRSWWVGPKHTTNPVHLVVTESDRLVSTDWASPVSLADCEIVPVATYEVVAVNVDTGAESTPLAVSTAARPDKHWADCSGPLGMFCTGNWAPCGDALCPQPPPENTCDFGAQMCADGSTPCGDAVCPEGESCVEQWPPPDGYINFQDVAAAVFTFQEAPGLTIAKVENLDLHGAGGGDPNADPPNYVVNFADIADMISAFQGYPYKYHDPGDCPDVGIWP